MVPMAHLSVEISIGHQLSLAVSVFGLNINAFQSPSVCIGHSRDAVLPASQASACSGTAFDIFSSSPYPGGINVNKKSF